MRVCALKISSTRVVGKRVAEFGYNDSLLDFITSPLCLDCLAAVETDTDTAACCQRLIIR